MSPSPPAHPEHPGLKIGVNIHFIGDNDYVRTPRQPSPFRELRERRQRWADQNPSSSSSSTSSNHTVLPGSDQPELSPPTDGFADDASVSELREDSDPERTPGTALEDQAGALDPGTDLSVPTTTWYQAMVPGDDLETMYNALEHRFWEEPWSNRTP